MDIVVHELLQALEHAVILCQQVLLVDAAVVEVVEGKGLGTAFQGLVVRLLRLCHHMPQNGSLEGAGLVVATVEDKAAVQLVQCIVVAALCSADAGGLEVACICPGFVPRRFPKELIRFVSLMLVLECKGQVEDGFAVVGVGVALLPYPHGLSQVGLCLVKASAAQVPQSCLVQTAHVIRVAAQGLFVVVECRPGGMAVLLQV